MTSEEEFNQRLDAFADEQLLCDQFGCSARALYWCRTCRGFFCGQHAPLEPRRRHDCVKGRAQEHVPGDEKFPIVLALALVLISEALLIFFFGLSGQLPGLPPPS